MVADSLEPALVTSRRGLALVGFRETLRKLEEKGLVSEYSAMVRDYLEAGIVDTEVLDRIAGAVGADHLFDVRVGYAELATTRELPKAGDIAKAVVVQDLRLTARIWSPQEGKIVWKADATAQGVAGELTTERAGFEMSELMGPICRHLAWTVPLGGVAATSQARPVAVRDWTDTSDKRRWSVRLVNGPERRLYFESGDMVVWTAYPDGPELMSLSEKDLRTLFLKASGAAGT